jgi:hypothetical protein
MTVQMKKVAIMYAEWRDAVPASSRSSEQSARTPERLLRR